MNNMKKPLSIYVHIPFCVRKCAYCDFLSAPATNEVQEQYLHKLIEEIRVKSPDFHAYEVKTIFFGGGTPTAVDARLLCEVLRAIKVCFEVNANAEISLECNPGTASKEALLLYKEAGFNRLSIGLQSTEEHLLRKLGRIHNYAQFVETFEAAREVGFANINVDLMSALPDQTLENYVETLRKVLAMKPEHISAYSLIIEEGTPFYEMDLNLPTEDVEREMYEMTEQVLREEGYARYEISNYALPGFASKHNVVYWKRGAYLGLGLGAASLICKDGQEFRLKNNSDLSSYIEGMHHYEETLSLSKREAMEEFFFLGLRMMEGVDIALFQEVYGNDAYKKFEAAINESIDEGLLCLEGTRLFLTPRGIDVSNYVFQKFLE